MDELARLSFYVLLQRVKDSRSGLPMVLDEAETIELWARLAGISSAAVYALCERARRGELSGFTWPEPGRTPGRETLRRYGVLPPREPSGQGQPTGGQDSTGEVGLALSHLDRVLWEFEPRAEGVKKHSDEDLVFTSRRQIAESVAISHHLEKLAV